MSEDKVNCLHWSFIHPSETDDVSGPVNRSKPWGNEQFLTLEMKIICHILTFLVPVIDFTATLRTVCTQGAFRMFLVGFFTTVITVLVHILCFTASIFAFPPWSASFSCSRRSQVCGNLNNALVQTQLWPGEDAGQGYKHKQLLFYLLDFVFFPSLESPPPFPLITCGIPMFSIFTHG